MNLEKTTILPINTDNSTYLPDKLLNITVKNNTKI